ncbi:MAG: hypothetical protein ABSG03_11925 [Bryobacteraceae bacterium]|jgi:hypothetical protein
MTNRAVFPLFAAILFAFYSPSAAPVPHQENQQQPKKDAKNASDSMTGCIDEQDGHYVLTNDRDLALIAVLEADGFPTEAFAKHVGHKVTVRGTAIPGGTHPTFKVRGIAMVSDTCAPQHQQS